MFSEQKIFNFFSSKSPFWDKLKALSEIIPAFSRFVGVDETSREKILKNENFKKIYIKKFYK